MTRDKFKKGDLIKTGNKMWGYYFSPNFGNVNIEIEKNTIFIVTSSPEETFNPDTLEEIQCLIDNKIVAINLKEEDQLEVLNVDFN